jgi:hypothetical protein
MKKLEFSYNWNNKLDCRSFSTVRLANPNKYQLLELYEVIQHNGKNKPVLKRGIARLQAITPFYLDKVTPGITFLDTNLPKIDFIKLVKTMYKNKNIDFNKKRMYFLIFQYLDNKELKKLNLN